MKRFGLVIVLPTTSRHPRHRTGMTATMAAAAADANADVQFDRRRLRRRWCRLAGLLVPSRRRVLLVPHALAVFHVRAGLAFVVRRHVAVIANGASAADAVPAAHDLWKLATGLP